jgi:ribonuclease HII
VKVFCDEVATGATWGPLIVCAVADNNSRPIEVLKDSKQYSRKKREKLFEILSTDLIYAYGAARPSVIEEMNVHYAKLFAMRQAVERLVRRGVEVDEVIIDGKFTIPNLDLPQTAIIKADETIWPCSAASILAKVVHDRIITNLSRLERFQGYDLNKNAGYYTKKHFYGIIRNGITELHRRNYKLIKYAKYEYDKRIELGISPEQYIEQLELDNKNNDITRYAKWLCVDKIISKCGEKRW